MYWLLSILILIAFAVGCGYAVYGLTRLCKITDRDSRESCGGFTALAIGCLGLFFVFIASFNACMYRHSSYEEEFNEVLPLYLILAGVVMIVVMIVFVTIAYIKDKSHKDDHKTGKVLSQKEIHDIEWEKWRLNRQTAEVETKPERPVIKIEVKAVEDEEKELIRMKYDLANILIDGISHPAALLDLAYPRDYASRLLSISRYPFQWPREIETGVRGDTLVVDYRLPAPDDVPDFLDIAYKRDQPTLIVPNEKREKEVWSNLCYQIILRSIYELFYSPNLSDEIKAISFNGRIRSTDPATGNESVKCIMSVLVKRKTFMNLDFTRIEPSLCFKRLKGVAAHDLASLTPIPPILPLNKEDKRFVSPADVLDAMDSGYNLASMDWKDFENLIRELFEKEFSSGGGEVRITRASRDGGVDAVVFDPDPIRGGKIIIQAKRYTNVVGVSAVRDLYGTVHNEGAIKGILVTTSDYGSDSYNFAKDKPLTLLNGANLLHLMSKHGYQARIDIPEAKRTLRDVDYE